MHELNPIKIFFGGFNGGYGKMLVYNLRSEFLKHKITIKDSKIEPWIARSKKQQEHVSRTQDPTFRNSKTTILIKNQGTRIQEIKDRIN